MKIIDCRLRPPTDEFRLVFQVMQDSPLHETSLPEWMTTMSVDDCIKQMEDMDIIGVMAARVFRGLPGKQPDNEHVKMLVDKYPGRWIPLGHVDFENRREAQKEMDKVAKWGFKGIAIELPTKPWLPNDRRLWPLYAQMEDLDLVCAFTTGGMCGPMESNLPQLYEPMAKDFPNLRIMLTHGCYPQVEDMIQLLWMYPNIWSCPDGYWTRPLYKPVVEECNFPGDHKYGHVWSMCFTKTRERMLYGSAFPLSPPLDVALSDFKELGWTEEALEHLLYKNAAELFKLDEK